MRAIV